MSVVAASVAWPHTVRAASSPATTILVLGDSLSAEYGLTRGSGWVALLGARLAQAKIAATVVNASISGDTTSGGRSRLPALLAQHRPGVVVIELGGNDALRGLPLAMTRDNLTAMAQAAKAAGAKVLIAGMQLPPNYGPAYVREFNALFGDIAKARKAALVAHVFEGFGEDLAQFQPDRIHPTAAAQQKILANVWPALAPLLHKR